MADVLRPRRTRVKSGCLCCRLRRKKCDERKPTCSGCDRNKLICSWAPSSSSPGRPSDLDWRGQLGSGESVSRTGKDFTASIAAESSSNSPALFQKRLKREYSMNPSPANQLRLPEMFGTASLNHPSSRILFEHYINNTSNLLCGIRGPENPFITCVIPLARTDSMIMDCVLALSGAHLGYATSSSDVQLASSTHYALALRQFKHTLTNAVSGKDLKPVNLLLTALMLCHVESVSGNSNGAIFHHLRASSHFVRLLLALNSDQVDYELRGFLLETYSYFVSVVNVTANTDSDYRTVIFEPYSDALEGYRGSKAYGAMMGCAQDLFELIPSICKLGYRRIAEENNKKSSFETIALYKSLETKIQNWQPPQVIIKDDCSVNERITAAKLYQQALLVFLHTNFYGSQISDPNLLSLIDASLEVLFPIVNDLPEDTPIMSTLLWPCMIIGSCLRHPLHRMLLRHQMLASPFNMLLVSKTVQILDWLWEDEGFGPYGLGTVMKKHKITHCMG